MRRTVQRYSDGIARCAAAMRRWRAGWYPTCAISGAINSPDAIRTVVIDGALQHNGMVSFKTALKLEEVEHVRQYVIKRANEDKKLVMK